MKKIYFFLLLIVTTILSAQYLKENKDRAMAEGQRLQKMITFNENPNTQNYDLRYQRLEADLDPAQLFIGASVTSHFFTKQSLGEIYFDFTDQIMVSAVEYHGINLSFQQLPTKEIKITLPTALAANTLDSLTIRYAGIPDNSGRASFYVGTHAGTPVLATLSEPYGAQNWFPTKQSMSDKIDRFDMKITAPDVYRVASNGLLIAETVLPGNKKQTFWRTQYPTAAYLIALSIGDFVKSTETIGLAAAPFINYLYPDTAASPAVQSNLQWTKTAMSIFEQHFGPYPFSAEKYGHMEIAINGACMEHQTMSSMNSFGKPEIAHELAHQWFGDKITCGAWNDIWLNEGFATFAEQLIFEKNVMTPVQFHGHLQNQLNIITSLPDGSVYVADSNLGSIPKIFDGRLTYLKGGYVLRMLKWILGEDAFFNVLKAYAANPGFAYRYARTQDFQQQILLTSGQNLSGFFADWIYGEGYPSYEIRWKQDSATQTVHFLVAQQQSHSSVNFFELPLPLSLTGTNGEKVDLRLNNTTNGQSFSVPLNFVVAQVEFNKDLQIIEKNSVVIPDPNLAVAAAENEKIRLYPNPAGATLTVEGALQNRLFTVYSSTGQIALQGRLNSANHIDVAKLLPGSYILQIAGKQVKFLKK